MTATLPPEFVEIASSSVSGGVLVRLRTAEAGSVDLSVSPAEAESLAAILVSVARADSEARVDALAYVRGTIKLRPLRVPHAAR